MSRYRMLTGSVVVMGGLISKVAVALVACKVSIAAGLVSPALASVWIGSVGAVHRRMGRVWDWRRMARCCADLLPAGILVCFLALIRVRG